MNAVKLIPVTEEYLYEYSFDQVVQEIPYNIDTEKRRITIYYPPLIFERLPIALINKYHILKSENHIQATRLGCSILQHDDRIKELVQLSRDAFESTDEFDCNVILAKYPFIWKTTATTNTTKLSVLEWVGQYISENIPHFGLSQNHLGICIYLIGIQSASELIPKHKEIVDKEIVGFWEYIAKRAQLLNSFIKHQ